MLTAAKMYRVRLESPAANAVRTEGKVTASHLDTGDVAEFRVRNLRVDHGQHGRAGHEGQLAPLTSAPRASSVKSYLFCYCRLS